jgi:HEAT repeat protein
MVAMKRNFFRRALTIGMGLVLAAPLAFAKVKVSKLAKKLLYGDEATRIEAVKAFNKLPADEQYKLVPDFMVALTDDDPQVRKIASRILKAMGVKTEAQIPDVKKEMPAPESQKPAAEQLKEEKKLEQTELPPAPPELTTPPPKPSTDNRWTDLENMRQGQSNNYDDLKQQIEQEKKGQVTLDSAELRAGSDSYTTPLSTVVDSLKDPDPWVRAQAARRLGMVHPAPVEVIPTLITMLDDKHTECRQAGAAALGSFGPLAREAVPALNKALADPDNAVSQIAAEALKQIQQP